MATKPWLLGNMIPNIKTCETGWSNFSENSSVMALKLLASQKLQFNLILYGVGVLSDRGRFSVHSPFIAKSMLDLILVIYWSYVNESEIQVMLLQVSDIVKCLKFTSLDCKISYCFLVNIVRIVTVIVIRIVFYNPNFYWNSDVILPYWKYKIVVSRIFILTILLLL